MPSEAFQRFLDAGQGATDEDPHGEALLEYLEACSPDEFRQLAAWGSQSGSAPAPTDSAGLERMRQRMIQNMREQSGGESGGRANIGPANQPRRQGTRNQFDNGLAPNRHLPMNLFGAPPVDRTNTLLNHIDSLGPGSTSLQDFNDAIRDMETMSLEDLRELQLDLALEEAEDTDDEDFTIDLFQGYTDAELEGIRQRQIDQARRYFGSGGRGEIPGVPAVPSNSQADDPSRRQPANTNADFDRMLHEIENCTVERFRELAIQMDIDDGGDLEPRALAARYRAYNHGQLERIRQRMIQGLRQFAPDPAVGASNDSRDIPFLEQDNVVFRRKVIAARGKRGLAPVFISAEEAKRVARERIDTIFAEWDTLRGVLERHEAVIQKRWTKKTKAQKQKIILAAWPGMSANHRPDFAAARREPNRHRSSTSDRDAFVWPDMNLEDLLRPRTLLILINARGRNLPCAFWNRDIDACHVGYTVSAIDEPYLNRHIMLLKDKTTAETYGELRSFDTSGEGMELMRGFTGLPPGTGLVVLEIQQRIMQFLVKCCKEILHDIPTATLLDAPVSPEPTISAPTTNGFTSLSEMLSDAPYRLPQGVDYPRLKAIFNAKRSAAEDHIWSLREDPSYFVETLKEAMDHRYEHVKPSHINLQPTREHLVWGPVIGNVVASGDYYLEIWSKLCAMTDEHEEILTKRDPKEEMSKEVKFDLTYFKVFLEHSMRGPLAQLKANFHSNPQLRQYFERRAQDDELARKTGICRLSPRTNCPFNKGKDGPEEHLMWLVNSLVDDGMDSPFGIVNLVDELGRLLQAEPKARNLVSPHMANVISDLAVLTEALRQLDVYKGKLHSTPLMDMKDDGGKVIKGLTVPWINMLGDIEGKKPQDLYKLGSPTSGRFHYPVDKRRTKENHQAMQAAERNLDEFWGQVDRNLEVRRQWHLDHLAQCDKCCDCGVETAVRKLLSGSRYVQRTGDWVEPTNNEPTTAKQSELDDAARRPLSELYFDLERRTERTIARDHKHPHSHDHQQQHHPHSHDHQHQHHDHGHNHGKLKTKTRGIPSSSKENIPPVVEPSPSAEPDKQPIFALDARALKVFRTLFFTPSISSTPGEVPWTDFLHAMKATGFAAEQLYGSVWNFVPTDLDVERSIQFHEPHPSSKIPYRNCRRHGRRLEKAFGWHGGMFVLASSQGREPLRDV